MILIKSVINTLVYLVRYVQNEIKSTVLQFKQCFVIIEQVI